MITLLARLRDETQGLHAQTEQVLYADTLRAGALSVDQYQHLLLLHGAFHQALERAIDQHPVFFEGYAPDTRRKTPWLLDDLAQFQLALPIQPGLFADWSVAALLGAAYVGEGSMLGGKTVWHYLQQSSALQPLLGQARFYRGYGDETGGQWRAFGTFMGRQTVDPLVVVSGASRAFGLYQDLFSHLQPANGVATARPAASLTN